MHFIIQQLLLDKLQTLLNLAADSFFQILFFSVYLIASNFTLILIFGLGSITLIIPTLFLTKKGRSFAHITYTLGGKIAGFLRK